MMPERARLPMFIAWECCGNWKRKSSLDTAYTEQCVGLINDDETPVGQVHLGVVHLFDVSEPLVAPRETEILNAGFLPIDEILAGSRSV